MNKINTGNSYSSGKGIRTAPKFHHQTVTTTELYRKTGIPLYTESLANGFFPGSSLGEKLGKDVRPVFLLVRRPSSQGNLIVSACDNKTYMVVRHHDTFAKVYYLTLFKKNQFSYFLNMSSTESST